MDAVGVEGSVCHLAWIRDAHVNDGFPVLVPDHEFASLSLYRKGDHERGNHPINLLRVAMTGEEPSRLVDEELVELGTDTPLRQSQFIRNAHQDRSKRPVPARTLELDTVCADLPAVAYRPVENCFLAAPVGCPLGNLDQRLDLGQQDRPGDGSN